MQKEGVTVTALDEVDPNACLQCKRWYGHCAADNCDLLYELTRIAIRGQDRKHTNPDIRRKLFASVADNMYIKLDGKKIDAISDREASECLPDCIYKFILKAYPGTEKNYVGFQVFDYLYGEDLMYEEDRKKYAKERKKEAEERERKFQAQQKMLDQEEREEEEDTHPRLKVRRSDII